MRISLAHDDPAMPRTVFWDRFRTALRANHRFVEDPARADMLFPAEDLAQEANWPRYGNLGSAMVRGTFDVDTWQTYINGFVSLGRRVCIVNMHPGYRLPQLARQFRHVYIADNCLAGWERSVNPRTISMPSMPITVGTTMGTERPVRASFRGVPSHPCRNALRQLHDGSAIVCDLVEPDNHSERIDAENGTVDSPYVELMARSRFAFVPRGDSLFSYRLLEAMSFGCIPVVISDGWVLPFDRSVDWAAMAVHLPEAEVGYLPAILDTIDDARLADMRASLAAAWHARFATLDAIVETLLTELEAVTSREEKRVNIGDLP